MPNHVYLKTTYRETKNGKRIYGETNTNRALAHIKYVGFRSKELGDEKGFFNERNERCGYKDFFERVRTHNALQHSNTVKIHKLFFALKEDEYKIYKEETGKDLKDLVRETIKTWEEKEGLKLDWIANIHHEEQKNPHCHVIIKGVSDNLGDRGYKRIKIYNETCQQLRKDFDKIFERDTTYNWELARQQREIEKEFALKTKEQDKTNSFDKVNSLAKNNITDITKVLKKAKESSLEIKKYMKDIELSESKIINLYNNDEKKLAELITDFSKKISENNFINYKYLSTDLKVELYKIADFVLDKPQFDELIKDSFKNVEELAKLHNCTEKEIDKLKFEALNQINTGISQLVLKSAMESNRQELFYVDKDLSNKAVEFIKNMTNSIDISKEHTETLTKLSNDLKSAYMGLDDIRKIVIEYSEKENLNLSSFKVEEIIRNIENDNAGIEYNVTNKLLNNYISSYKIAGMNESDTFKKINEIINKTSQNLSNELENLKSSGIIDLKNNSYTLTIKGIDEFLKIKHIEQSEKEIFKVLDTANITENGKGYISYDTLIKNKDVLTTLRNKEIKPFNLSKFDTNVRVYFGEDNKLSFEQLKNIIYDKYSNNTLEFNVVKADKELNIIKSHIEKLATNGYIVLDKETQTFSYTDETLKYFDYDTIKDRYNLTKEAIEKFNVPLNIEFSSYDNSVTCSYIDKADNNILIKENLKAEIFKEISNKDEAEKQFKYLTWRLDNLKKQGYFQGDENTYKLTDKGIERRELIITPQREYLNKTLNYLNKLGLIEKNENNGYRTTEKYQDYIKNLKYNKENNIERKSDLINKKVYRIIEQTQDNVNVNNIKINQERMSMGKYINNAYDEVKTNYESVKNTYNIKDMTENTVDKITRTLLVSGLNKEEATTIIKDWNNRTNKAIEEEKLNKIIDKSYESYNNDKIWGKETFISTKEWNETYKNLGYEKEEAPKWIYKGYNWNERSNKSLDFQPISNDIGKFAKKFANKLKSEIKKEELKRDNKNDIWNKPQRINDDMNREKRKEKRFDR